MIWDNPMVRNMKELTGVKTPITPPQCECGSKDIRYHKRDNMYFCRVCGNEWEKVSKSEPKESERDRICNRPVAPNGFIVVEAHDVPARHIPAHIRPMPQKKVNAQ